MPDVALQQHDSSSSRLLSRCLLLRSPPFRCPIQRCSLLRCCYCGARLFAERLGCCVGRNRVVRHFVIRHCLAGRRVACLCDAVYCVPAKMRCYSLRARCCIRLLRFHVLRRLLFRRSAVASPAVAGLAIAVSVIAAIALSALCHSLLRCPPFLSRMVSRCCAATQQGIPPKRTARWRARAAVAWPAIAFFALSGVLLRCPILVALPVSALLAVWFSVTASTVVALPAIAGSVMEGPLLRCPLLRCQSLR